MPTLRLPSDIEVILLAAGASRRMGPADKLLLPTAPGGVPLAVRSALPYRQLGLPITAVVPGLDGPVAKALAEAGTTLVSCPPRATPLPSGDDGQQSSLRAGLAAAPLGARGVLVALADMPWLTSSDIAAHIACFADAGANHICIPRFAGRRGNPVLFPSAVLRALRDDPAAPAPRAFIAAHPERICWHEAATDHCLRDIDTPDDAASLSLWPQGAASA